MNIEPHFIKRYFAEQSLCTPYPTYDFQRLFYGSGALLLVGSIYRAFDNLDITDFSSLFAATIALSTGVILTKAKNEKVCLERRIGINSALEERARRIAEARVRLQI